MDFDTHFKNFIELNKLNNSASSFIAGSYACDDLGRLDEDGHKALKEREAEYAKRDKEINDVLAHLKENHAKEFSDTLFLIRNQLEKIKKYLGDESLPEEHKNNFDLSLINTLLEEFHRILNNEEIKYVRCWAYAVSDRIIQDYSQKIK